MASYIWYDCATRNNVILIVILLVVLCYMKSPIESFWSPVYTGKSSWYPVKNKIHGSIFKENMLGGAGIYDMPYMINGASEYTTPYSGKRGYGQNFGSDGPPLL